MSFSKVARYASAIAFASQVAAHGTVTGIVADGVYYEGYHADFQYMANPPVTVGWLIPEDLSNGFIAPDAYATGDIICHLNATNAQTSAPVAAGGTVNLQWTAWPSSHHGPVIDYLANCNGDCATVDKTTLEWFKIDGVGLIDDTTVPGTWASDQLIANNNSWTVNIPSTIASGNYVLRHEIIALHSAGTVDGAQNYPQCVNLQITGSGTDTPTGTLGEALYTETDPGIEINIYTSIATYTVPGPTQYSGATVSATQSGGDTATSIAPVGTTTPAASEATTSASAEAVTTSASSSQAVATSATKSSSVATSSAAAVTASPIYTNGTISAASPQGTGSSRSVSCKKKSKTSSAAVLPTSAINVAVKASSTADELTSTATVSSEATATASVAIATATEGSSGSSSGGSSSGSTTTGASSSSSTSTSDAVSMPSGTTLGNLLEWISSFYTTHKDTTYTGSTTVTRRHARDVVARGIDGEISSYRRY